MTKLDAIATALRQRIQGGELTAGAQLPTVQELAAEHGCAPATAQAALGQLRREGLITTLRGRRAVVNDLRPMRVLRWDRYARQHKDHLADSTWEEEMAEAGWAGSVTYLEVDWSELPSWAAEALEEPTGAAGVVRRRVRVAAPRREDGSVDETLRRPLELFTSYIPAWVARRAPEVLTFGSPRHGGSYYSIQDQGGIRLWPAAGRQPDVPMLPGGRYRRKLITARPSTEAETKALGLARPEPVTEELRVIWSAVDQDPEVAGRPVTVDRCVTVGQLTYVDDFPLT